MLLAFSSIEVITVFFAQIDATSVISWETNALIRIIYYIAGVIITGVILHGMILISSGDKGLGDTIRVTALLTVAGNIFGILIGGIVSLPALVTLNSILESLTKKGYEIYNLSVADFFAMLITNELIMVSKVYFVFFAIVTLISLITCIVFYLKCLKRTKNINIPIFILTNLLFLALFCGGMYLLLTSFAYIIRA